MPRNTRIACGRIPYRLRQEREAANADLDGTAALCEEQGVVAKALTAKKALPNCNIVCLTGDELKTNASAYLQVLFDADPKAVGGAACPATFLLDCRVISQ